MSVEVGMLGCVICPLMLYTTYILLFKQIVKSVSTYFMSYDFHFYMVSYTLVTLSVVSPRVVI